MILCRYSGLQAYKEENVILHYPDDATNDFINDIKDCVVSNGNIDMRNPTIYGPINH